MIQYRRSRVHCHVVPAIITVTTPKTANDLVDIPEQSLANSP